MEKERKKKKILLAKGTESDVSRYDLMITLGFALS